MKNNLYFLIFLVLAACAQPKPRKPVSHTGSVDLSRSIAYNKQLAASEQKAIDNYIRSDSSHTYYNSNRGFWYTYMVKNEKDTVTPKSGQTVTFRYSVHTLDGEEVYSEEETGEKTYKVDKEDFMKGIQEGIKLMKVNERIRFLLLSQQAYGFAGDDNKIGINTPLVVEVELLSIEE